jgi:hypothetical protein
MNANQMRDAILEANATERSRHTWRALVVGLIVIPTAVVVLLVLGRVGIEMGLLDFN